MKVFLPAITGLVPPEMVQSVAAFLEVCYIVRRSQISEDDLDKLDNAVARFHAEREIFITKEIRTNFNNIPWFTIGTSSNFLVLQTVCVRASRRTNTFPL